MQRGILLFSVDCKVRLGAKASVSPTNNSLNFVGVCRILSQLSSRQVSFDCQIINVFLLYGILVSIAVDSSGPFILRNGCDISLLPSRN